MIRSYNFACELPERSFRQSLVGLAAFLLFSGFVAAQELPPAASRTESVLAAPSTPGEQGPHVLEAKILDSTAQPFRHIR